MSESNNESQKQFLSWEDRTTILAESWEQEVPERTYPYEGFPELKNSLVLDSIAGKKLERFPVWAMRQAGRYLPEFKAAREGIDFFDCIKMVDKVVDITIQPVRRFDIDAAIIFQDIMNVPEAMGLDVTMVAGQGPTINNPLQTEEDVDKLKTSLTDELDYFYDSLFVTRHKLGGVVPLFGFCGGPWTLACYMIEGKGPKSFTQIKKWMYEKPDVFKKLIGIMAPILTDFLINQIKAGAQLAQVFESHLGELSPYEFTEFVLPALQAISAGVKEAFPEVPLFIFPRKCHHCYEQIAGETKFDVIGLDETQSISGVRARVGDRVALQGNLEQCWLFAGDEDLKKETLRMVGDAGDTKYVANLGWGMVPDHDPEKLKLFVDTVHEHTPE